MQNDTRSWLTWRQRCHSWYLFVYKDPWRHVTPSTSTTISSSPAWPSAHRRRRPPHAAAARQCSIITSRPSKHENMNYHWSCQTRWKGTPFMLMIFSTKWSDSVWNATYAITGVADASFRSMMCGTGNERRSNKSRQPSPKIDSTFRHAIIPSQLYSALTFNRLPFSSCATWHIVEWRDCPPFSSFWCLKLPCRLFVASLPTIHLHPTRKKDSSQPHQDTVVHITSISSWRSSFIT